MHSRWLRFSFTPTLRHSIWTTFQKTFNGLQFTTTYERERKFNRISTFWRNTNSKRNNQHWTWTRPIWEPPRSVRVPKMYPKMYPFIPRPNEYTAYQIWVLFGYIWGAPTHHVPGYRFLEPINKTQKREENFNKKDPGIGS